MTLGRLALLIAVGATAWLIIGLTAWALVWVAWTAWWLWPVVH